MLQFIGKIGFSDWLERDMDRITSRKNSTVLHLRALAADGAYRRERGEFLCDGHKLLTEANAAHAEITSILWREGAIGRADCERQFCAPEDLFDYASPLKNSPGPLFTVRLPAAGAGTGIKNAIVLENLQDPGNVGTVLRTAAAFSVDAVILCGDCADLYSPKTVRATMGAIFRQRAFALRLEELPALLRRNGLRLYGAALSDAAQDVRKVDITNSAVAVGSEGRGLSEALLSLCDGEVIIPMDARSESLNAAVAASVLMWEMSREEM